MLTKILQLIQDVMGGVAFIALVAISTLTVMNLNPRIYSQDVNANSQVAGLNVDREGSLPLQITNISTDDPYYRTQITEKSSKLFEYKISFLRTEKGSALQKKFIKISNLNDYEYKVSLRAFIPRDIQNLVKVSAHKGIDQITLFDKNLTNNGVVTVPPSGELDLDLYTSFSESINFPFEIIVEITY